MGFENTRAILPLYIIHINACAFESRQVACSCPLAPMATQDQPRSPSRRDRGDGYRSQYGGYQVYKCDTAGTTEHAFGKTSACRIDVKPKCFPEIT